MKESNGECSSADTSSFSVYPSSQEIESPANIPVPVSPFVLRPFGKAPTRKETKRKAMSSAIYTSSPVKKKQLEEQKKKKNQRGRHKPEKKIDRSEIREHIKKCNPAVHHYRREHAPNRLYLPSDITSSDMHADFCKSIRQIGIETYRKEIRAQNISFATLGAEECEVCKRYKEHTDEIENVQLCD
ncbi:CAI-1 autoinducer sensor kinase/phosphatase CqsS [Elysia marginata]|uniref:CAI-1 autoinducer sensor kinase/phosphatase CqsS n=1 Tax=Elysia marginata TaxID=1093978 RepID=A0AAV4GZQ7_9GAST|nr:CAI-1 autoinducer sensor kinase/phosphatase CqsS [Elysia marginata]